MTRARSVGITGTTAGGFTLVETLLALSLIGIGVLAVAPLFVLAIESNAASEDFSTAGALAVERMELLRAEGYFDLVAGGSLTTNVTGYVDTSEPGYVVRWSVTDNITPAVSKTLRVRVVADRQVIGERKEVTLTLVRGR